MLVAILSCVVAACLIPRATFAEERRPTDLCGQLPPYDISSLTSKAYWFSNVTYPQLCLQVGANATSCTIYFAFCKSLVLPFSATNCSGSAVCLVGRDATGKEVFDVSLGRFVANTTQFFETNGTVDGGFYTDFSGGSRDQRCNDTVASDIDLVCSSSAQWNTQNLTNVTSNVDFDNDNCLYKITLSYDGACLPPTPSTSTTMPTPSSTMSPSTTSSTTLPPTSSSSMTSSPSSVTSSPTSSMTTSSSPMTPSSTVIAPPIETPTTAPPTTVHPEPPTTVKPPTPPHDHSTTSAAPAKPTDNPLASKVSGLTAGIVIFALLSVALALVLVGVVWYFKFHKKATYDKILNEDM